MYSRISIYVGSKDTQCGTRYTACAKLMFVKLSYPEWVTRNTRESEFSTPCQKLHNIRAATLPASNSTVREFGKRVGRETLDSEPLPWNKLSLTCVLIYRGDVNLWECSVGRVYTSVYNYIWRDIKRRCMTTIGEDQWMMPSWPLFPEFPYYRQLCRIEKCDFISHTV